jgi:uncharacterized delta-60 repeat protein
MTRLRWTSVAAIAASGLVLGALAFACGTDDGVSPPACSGVDCDGGSVDATLADGGADANITDASSDGEPADAADASAACPGPAGTLDPTFGDGGIVWLKYPGSGANAVVVQLDGKIVVGGYTGPRKFAVVRILPDGSLDPSFGAAGLVETTLGVLNPGYVALALQGDGKIVAVGTTTYAGGKQDDFAVVRYLSNGTIDPAFGDGGAVVTDFSSTNDNPASVRLLPDGRILVGGQSEPTGANPNTDFALVRLNTDGSLDTTFGTGGKVRVDVHGTQDHGGYVALLPGGRAIIGGQSGTTAGNTAFEMSAAGLNADGTLDPTFADAGKMVTSFGGSGSQRVLSAAVDATGRILLGGVYSGSGPDDFGALRLAPSGAFDTTFGDGGLVATDFNGQSDEITALLPQSDGKLLVAGFSVPVGGGSSIASARYLASGQLDPTFGTGGRTTTAPPANADLTATAAAINGCTFITVGTWGYNNNTVPDTAIGIARYRR